MIAFEVLADLRHRGVELFVAGGTLRYRAPRGVLTPELRAALSAHKAELLSLLTGSGTGGRLNPADCLDLLCAFHQENEATYRPGALPWAFDNCLELKRRFEQTEAVIDRLAGQHPTETDFRAALAAHAACLREISARYRAHLEQQTERADRAAGPRNHTETPSPDRLKRPSRQVAPQARPPTSSAALRAAGAAEINGGRLP